MTKPYDVILKGKGKGKGGKTFKERDGFGYGPFSFTFRWNIFLFVIHKYIKEKEHMSFFSSLDFLFLENIYILYIPPPHHHFK